MVIDLAAELKRFSYHFPVIQGSMDLLELWRLRVILYRCVWHLADCSKYFSTHLGIYSHERSNYLSDGLGSGEKR